MSTMLIRRDMHSRMVRQWMVRSMRLTALADSILIDDVQPDDGEDQSGKVNAGDPVLFTVAVGGKSAAGDGSAAMPNARHSSEGQPYDREAPPPPPGRDYAGAEPGKHGLRRKLRGFASNMLK